MPYERIIIDLAVKLGTGDAIPAALLQKPTTAQLNAMANMTWLQIIRQMIVRFKALAEKINDREDTVKAKRHTCRHDIFPNESCVEEDIV